MIKIIGAYAFSDSKPRNIKIPSHKFVKLSQVTQICEDAFFYCVKLSKVEFEANSELRTIEDDAFEYSNLSSIPIPSHVTQIRASTFSGYNHLSRVEFEQNSELQAIEDEEFCRSNLESILIPEQVTQIHPSAFSSCKQLQIVEIEGILIDVSNGLNIFGDCHIIKIPAQNELL